jgi:hypothetical protein
MPGQVNVIGTLRSKGVVRVVDGRFADMDEVPYDAFNETVWSVFAGLNASDYVNTPVLITDASSSSALDGGLLVRGSASNVWILVDGQIVCTYATLPTAAAKYAGWIAFISDLGVHGTYLRCTGSIWISHNSGSILLYNKNFGTLASPTLTISTGITAATKFNVGTDPKIPANLQGADSKIRVKARFKKSGANATIVPSIYLGTSASSSDSLICAATVAASDNVTTLSAPTVDVITTTAIITTYTGTEGGNGGVGAHADRSTNINFASDMYVTVYAGAKNTNDTLSLMSLSVWLEAI